MTPDVLRFLARRLLLAIPVLLGVATLVFALIHLIPGDPVRTMLGESASEESVIELRGRLGLDRPLYRQYGAYLRDLVHGNLGTSLRTNEPVASALAARIPATAELAAAAMIVAIVIAIPLGILAAARAGTFVDHLATTLALIGISMPSVWLGPLLAIIFAVELGWLPVSGRGTPAQLVLPALTLGAPLAAMLARMTRASVIDELRELYVRRRARAWRLARARGAAARVQEQSPSHRHGAGPAGGGRSHRRCHHRDDLRVAGHRPAADSVDRLPRLSARAGLHSVHRRDVRVGELAHGSRVRLARSANSL